MGPEDPRPAWHRFGPCHEQPLSAQLKAVHNPDPPLDQAVLPAPRQGCSASFLLVALIGP